MVSVDCPTAIHFGEKIMTHQNQAIQKKMESLRCGRIRLILQQQREKASINNLHPRLEQSFALISAESS